MKKRFLALFCLMAIFASVFTLAIKAEAATNYKVGYAIVDINPWVDPNDHSKGVIQELHLGGQGSKDKIRYVSYVHDDDGDGNVTYNYNSSDSNYMSVKSWSPDTDGGDGIHATCIAVTDSKGTTALFISVDALSAYSGWLNDVRKSIEVRLGADVIRQENIIMSGSHTHASLKFNDAEQLTGENAPYRHYYDRVITLITDAAEEAMNDRAAATMHKATVDAGTVTGFQMNFQRHWETKSYDAYDYKEGSSSKITFSKPYDIDFIQGSNFGRLNDLRNYIANKEGITPAPVPSGGKGVIFDSGDPEGHDGYVESGLVTTDDKMHLIQFKFSDTSKKPIVMVNWRAHTTEAGGDYAKTVKDSAGNVIRYECELSSDYVGPLRALMKANGYRMSFFLGGSGNLVINQFNSNSADVTKWRTTIKRNATTGVAQEGDCDAYGRLLWKVAQSGLNSTAMKTVQTPGDIVTVSSRLTYNRQVDSQGLRDALAAVKAEYPDTFNSSWDPYPYYYTSPTDGKLYIINSYFHANGINGRINNTAESTLTTTLSAVTLGKAAAFVVVPFEIADRYNSDNPFVTNDWNTLANMGFGTPFVLSCSNGGSGYIPHSMEYIYNTEEYYQKSGTNKNAPLVFGPGSYEANTTPTARGTGEKMVARLGEMLAGIGKNARTAYCEACKETVTWTPLYSYSTSTSYDGHYYLAEDMLDTGRLYVNKYRTVCLDLNGKTYKSNQTAIHTLSGSTDENSCPVLNLFDSVGTGKVIGSNHIGYSATDTVQYRGGTVVVSGGSIFNMYGGTLMFEKQDDAEAVPLSQGGVVCNLGTFNMYGGKIVGTDLEETTWVNANGEAPAHNGYGAAVYVADRATLNVSGGTITAGSVPATGQGRCVLLAGVNSVLNLSGDAVIDEIMLMSITYRQQLNVTGEFTGSAAVALGKSIAYAGTNGNGIGAHTDAVMKVNAMPLVTYAENDPNTPIYSTVVIAPDTVPDEKFDNKTLLRIRHPKGNKCEACGTSLEEWQPVYNTTRIPSNVSGHYYLVENITAENGIRIVAEREQTICLDLNGKTYEVNDTAIHPYQQANINVMDLSKNKLGQVISHPGTQTIGGVIMISANSSVNIYAGTYSYETMETAPSAVISGGVAYINNTGALNLYGGKLVGAELIKPSSTTVSTPGLGAAVTVLYGGKLNAAGGQIVSGTTPTGRAACVYLAAIGSVLELSGDAAIEEVYANHLNGNMIVVNGKYTGKTDLFYNTANAALGNGKDIGNSVNAEFTLANLAVTNSGGYSVQVSGTDLVLSTDHKVAIFADENDTDPSFYASIDDALSVYDGGIIRLLEAVTDDVELTENAYIDLNGFNLGGKVTVAEGKTLYCLDLATDDYDIEDGKYGKIASYSGNIQPLNANVQGSKDYMLITETSGISFHRVNLTLTHISLNPTNGSIRYKSSFEGDRLVAENVEQYGIAFRLDLEPVEETMYEGTYSAFTDFKHGEGANGEKTPGTAMVGIIKETNTDYANDMNANRPIYGRAYVLTKDGKYQFGAAECRTLREVLESVNSTWSSLEADIEKKNEIVALYNRFASVMKYWGLTNIANAAS